MTIKDLKEKGMLLLDCISGSTAYGLNTPQSDIDKKGVFIQPKKQFYGLTYLEQVSNESNDEVYFELKRYIELLTKNNPNILELLNTPPESVLNKHPVMDLVKPEFFLSKLCKSTFAGYAFSQIKKARGLHKKVLNPVDKNRKSVLDFCYVSVDMASIPLMKWLELNQYKQEDCGLVNISHMNKLYALFHVSQIATGYLKGIVSGADANEVCLSDMEKNTKPLAYLSFNKDAYSQYCKDFKAYWEWVEKRNEHRYEGTLAHGKNYDAKNMMHTFRLLNMAEEIAREGKIFVFRTDREFLLKIRSGDFAYDTLLKMADEKIMLIDELYKNSNLQDEPDIAIAEELLIEMRESVYKF